MKEMNHYWVKPFQHRVPVKGYSGLEIVGSEDLGLAVPPVVEQSVDGDHDGTLHSFHVPKGL